MTATEVKFTAGQRVHATELYDQFHEARDQDKANMNFSAHRQGHDPQYLGIIGKNYYAKPWGNDSSNIQAILNGPAYWKRVYYRPNIAEQFRQNDEADARRKIEESRLGTGSKAGASGSRGMSRSSSDSGVNRTSQMTPLAHPLAQSAPIADGYAGIKEKMKPFVERGGKPKINKMGTGERLNFFNTLGNKYHIKAGGKNINWEVQKSTHRSTPAEARWILSTYFRTDTTAVLSGCGSEPAFSSTT